jgi:multiple sugar transport system substrate-binding protein
MPPDLAVMPPREFPDLARSGAYEPLNAYMERTRKLKYVNLPSLTQEMFSIDGVQYGLPYGGFMYNSQAIYMNLDLLAQNGIPVPRVDLDDPNSGWTYNEFRAIARKLTADKNGDGTTDQWGYNTNTAGLGFWSRIVWNFGGDFLVKEPEWHSTINSPQTIAAFQFIQDLKFTDGAFGEGKQFKAGKMGMIETDIQYGREILGSAFSWGLVQVPRGDGGRWGIAQGHPVSILKGSRNKELAFAFIEHFLSDKVQVYLADRNLIAPQTNSSARRSEWIKADYDKSSFVFGRSKGQALAAPGYPEFETECIDAAAKIMKGDNAAVNIIQALHEKVKSILKSK